MDETVKEVSVVFVTRDEPPEVLQPADRPFNAPAAAVATEFATVLRRRLLAVLAMRTNQINTATAKPLTQRIAVGSSIVNQPASLSSQDSLIEQLLDERYFVRAGAGSVDAVDRC